MATSAVEIVNSALIKIGAERITALTDQVKSAKIANEQYNKLRKELLASHPWNFAVARKSLAQTVNTPEFGYEYEYAIPSDVLRILETDLLQDEAWEIEINATSGAKVLVTDAAAVKIKYIKDLTDTTKYSPLFEEVLACRLAADLAYSLAQSASLQQQMFQVYDEMLRRARSFDAQESSRQEPQANEWTDVRW